MKVIDDLNSLADLVRQLPDVYLRYSEGPDQDRRNGPSKDFEAGVVMPGWSVTPLAPELWWTREVRDWVARRVCKYVEMGAEANRRPWVLQGEVIGYGPDHEPLVTNFRPIAWLGPVVVEEARAHYACVFDRGRASAEIRKA